MHIYLTSRNEGPSMVREITHVDYVGSSFDSAVEAVGSFSKYEVPMVDIPKFHPESKTAAPRSCNPELVVLYAADGWWRSIVKIEL